MSIPRARARIGRPRAVLAAAAVLAVSAAGLASAPASAAQPTAGLQITGKSAPVAKSHAGSGDSPVLPDGFGPSAADAAAMQAAATRAHATGKPVAVSSLTSPTVQVEAEPGGGFHSVSNALPVRTRQSGRWVPVDLTLTRRADGSWAPKATAYGTVSFSGGGTAPLAVTRSGSTSLTLTWPTALPAPHVSGATATYPSVLPGVDLQVSATAAGGPSETLVVHDAAAARNPALASLRLGAKVHGGHLATAEDGGLAVTNAHGAVVADAPTPLQWDSNRTLPASRQPAGAKVAADASDAAHPGLAAHVGQVRARVASGALTLVPDRAMLTRASTVYPVFVDPSVNWHPVDYTNPAFDEVKQGCPGTSFYNKTGSLADNGYLGVGYNGWPEGSCNTGDEHAIYQWTLSKTIFGAVINSAEVDATDIYSASCSTTATVNLHWSKGIGSGTDWSNRPGYNSYSTPASFGPAYNPTFCPGNGSTTNGFNVLSPIKTAASGHAASFTATLSEDSMESSRNDLGFKRFSHNPTLQVFYDNPPSAPTAATMAAVSGAADAACDTTSPYPYMGKTIASTPPVLRAKVKDPNGDKLQATFQYWIDGTTTKYTLKSGDNLSSGTYATTSLPASFVSALTDGKTVDWDVTVTDGMASTTYTQSPTCHFTAEPSAPDEPALTSESNLFPNTDVTDAAVGAAAGTAGKFDITGSGTTATKFVYHLDVPPPTSNPPASETVPASSNKATVTVAPPSPGPHTLYVYAVDGAGDVSGTSAYPFLAAGHPNTTCASLAACFNNVGVSADSNMTAANFDGNGHSFSATDWANAGWTSGGKVTVDGATMTLPAFGSGQKDNLLAANQTVGYSGQGSALVFLTASTYTNLASPGAIAGDTTAPYVPAGTRVSATYCFSGEDADDFCPASGQITYTDGTSTSYMLTVPDWSNSDSSIAAAVFPHANGTTQSTANRQLYAFSVPVDPTRTIASVTLPDLTGAAGPSESTLHVFALGTRNTTAGTTEANGNYAAAPAGQSWTGAWSSATEGSYGLPGGGTFSNQTIRVALKPSVSGGTVRVKLDNALGTGKLSIGHATIALSSTPSAIGSVPAGTPTTLKFGGSQSVTVPVGGMVYSDPLAFNVTAGQYLLVSYQLSNAVPYLVQHSYAGGSYEYITASGTGDLTTSTSATPFTTNAVAYGNFTDLVTDLDVQSASVPTEAVLGDHLVDPFQPGTTLPNSNGYRVADGLTAAEPSTPTPYGVIAEGIESNQLMTDNPETYNGSVIGGPSVLSRLDRDILDQPGISTVIVDDGLEDLLAGATSDDLDANGYTALVQQLQGWGINVVLTSLTPCEGFTGDGATPNDPCTSTTDTNRTDVNAFLGGMNLGNPWATPAVYFADLDAAVAVTDSATGEEKLAAAADGGDHVNLSNPAFGALTTALLSPIDTWNLDDGDGMPVATDTAATDTLNTLNAAGANPNLGNNPLTLTGGATWATDATRGTVLSLDGSTGYAVSPNPQVVNSTGSFTLSAWVKLNAVGTTNQTVLAEEGTQNSPFYLQYNHSHTGSPGWALSFTSADTPTPTFAYAYTAGASANTWTHLVGVYNAATKTAQLYVNGTLAGTATGVTPWAATGNLVLGRGLYNGSQGDWMNGSVNGVQAYDYALTANQVTALYQSIP
ncbi:LamG-like jellyroll fold domain-containing protein [Streptomyces mirabilis]|uniref:LamG-like jellyroll fold domain-containing protein n=1 Tax=Streptomyces mirabilis TaxID=68239 RepID=UPI00366961DC